MWKIAPKKAFLSPIGYFEKLYLYCRGGIHAVRGFVLEMATYRLRHKTATKSVRPTSVRPEAHTLEERSSPTSMLTGPQSVLPECALGSFCYSDPLQQEGTSARSTLASDWFAAQGRDEAESAGTAPAAASQSAPEDAPQKFSPILVVANASSEMARLADDRFFVCELSNRLDLDLENGRSPVGDSGGGELPHATIMDGVGSGFEGGGGSAAGGEGGGGGGGGGSEAPPTGDFGGGAALTPSNSTGSTMPGISPAAPDSAPSAAPQVGATTTGVPTAPPPKATPTVQQMVSHPMAFEMNVGQTDEQVKFLARGLGYNFFLTNNQAVLSLARPSSKPVSDLINADIDQKSRPPVIQDVVAMPTRGSCPWKKCSGAPITSSAGKCTLTCRTSAASAWMTSIRVSVSNITATTKVSLSTTLSLRRALT
jgi:hypothetical protein